MTEPKAQANWAPCVCGCGPEDHQAIILRPICIDPGNRVLFEGTLGTCTCGCEMYRNLKLAVLAAASNA